jgi:hypothetical protein
MEWLIDLLEGRMSIEEARMFLDLIHSCKDSVLSGDYIFLLRKYGEILPERRQEAIEETIRIKNIHPSYELIDMAEGITEEGRKFAKSIFPNERTREDVLSYVRAHVENCEYCQKHLSEIKESKISSMNREYGNDRNVEETPESFETFLKKLTEGLDDL